MIHSLLGKEVACLFFTKMGSIIRIKPPEEENTNATLTHVTMTSHCCIQLVLP